MPDPLGELGLRDADQPTEAATIEHHRAMHAEFTPSERALIRLLLGIDPAPKP